MTDQFENPRPEEKVLLDENLRIELAAEDPALQSALHELKIELSKPAGLGNSADVRFARERVAIALDAACLRVNLRPYHADEVEIAAAYYYLHQQDD